MAEPFDLVLVDLQLPEDDWFWQDPNYGVYWLSISAVYETMPPPAEYYWGWKTREHFYNDDVVRIWMPSAPTVGGLPFIEGEPILPGWDMAFELTTHECFPVDHINKNPDILNNYLPDYNTWASVGYPRCWCSAAYQTAPPTAYYGSDYQCRGDTDGLFEGRGLNAKYVVLADNNLLGAAYQVIVSDPTWIANPTWICADFDHKAEGRGINKKWVTLADNNILSTYYQAVVGATPSCFP